MSERGREGETGNTGSKGGEDINFAAGMLHRTARPINVGRRVRRAECPFHGKAGSKEGGKIVPSPPATGRSGSRQYHPTPIPQPQGKGGGDGSRVASLHIVKGGNSRLNRRTKSVGGRGRQGM